MTTLVVAFGLLLMGSMGLTAYAKFTLLNHYHVDDYVAMPRARTLYWTACVAAFGLAVSIAGLGACTRIWWVALPAALFASFAVYRNSKAIYLRYSGKYRKFYQDRGFYSISIASPNEKKR